MHYVYLLKLPDDSYYVGQTENLKARLEKYVTGGVSSTVRFDSKELVWYCGFEDKKKAIDFEKYLKTASG